MIPNPKRRQTDRCPALGGGGASSRRCLSFPHFGKLTEGVRSAEITRKLGIGRASVYRVLGERETVTHDRRGQA
jgi:hypothetical protein